MRFRFNGVNNIDDENEHPLAGVECDLDSEFGMSMAGYNCVVLVDAATWCDRMDVDRDFAAFQGWLRGDVIEQEANIDVELERV